MNYSLQTVVSDLQRILSRIEENGNRSSEIVDDFAAMSESALRVLPDHLRCALEFGNFAQDKEDIELFERIKAKYRPRYIEKFYQAFALLIDAASFAAKEQCYLDYVGELYMQYGYPKPGAGQYFTPHPVCELMAQVTAGAVRNEAIKTLRKAFDRAMVEADMLEQILITSYLMAGMSSQGSSEAIEKINLLIAPYIEPIAINDPACGSGRLLLSYAQQVPRHFLNWGVYSFTGQDIDLNCVRMSRLNMHLYGLNVKPITWQQHHETVALVTQFEQRQKEARKINVRNAAIQKALQRSTQPKAQSVKCNGGRAHYERSRAA